jgi:hypothetical protein
MDGLTVLVVAIGSLLLALVAYLAAVDNVDPVPDPRTLPKKTGAESRCVTPHPNEDALGPYGTSPALYDGLLRPRR